MVYRVLLAVMMLAASAILPAQAADKIEVGFVGSPGQSGWPWYVGIHKGFFTEAGITIDPIYGPSALSLMQQLSAGSLDIVGGTGPTDPIFAIEKGAPVAVLRTVAQPSTYVLVAQKSIASIKALKGKTIITGGLKDISRIYVSRLMNGNDVAEGDYDVTVIGASAGRYAALQSGTVDAALLNPPVLFQAQAAGYPLVGYSYEYAKDMPFSVMAVNRNWAAAANHMDLLKRFGAAYEKSRLWFQDPANRAEAIDILRQEASLQEKEVADSYDFARQIDMFTTTGTVSTTQMQSVMTVLKGLGEMPEPVSMDRVALAGITQVVP
jgi:NitT/TauT family transport system substrate-binding protein